MEFIRGIFAWIGGMVALLFLLFLFLVVAPVLSVMYDNCVIPRPANYHYEAGVTYPVCEEYTFGSVVQQ